jgi:gas vesicle protein
MLQTVQRKGDVTMNIPKTADESMKTVSHGAQHARRSLIDFGTQVLKVVNTFGVLERAGESLMTRMGLQRRRSPVAPVLWFAAGGIVVGGAVLAFTPRSGKELRARIARLFDGAIDTTEESVKGGVEHAEKLGKSVASRLDSTVDDARKNVAAAGKRVESKVEGLVDLNVPNGHPR